MGSLDSWGAEGLFLINDKKDEFPGFIVNLGLGTPLIRSGLFYELAENR